MLDVTDYGATPNDDSNDDSIGIKAAISAAQPGSQVYLPAGRYTLRAGSIPLKTGVSLRGAGRAATVLETNMTTTVSTLFYASPGATDFHVSDFTVRRGGGIAVQLVIKLGNGRWDSDNTSYALVERVVLARLDISGFERMAIVLENTRNVMVWNNQLHDATALGGGGQGYGVSINFDRASNNWIVGNTVGPFIRHAFVLSYRTHHNLLELNDTRGTTQDAFDLHGEDEYNNELRSNRVVDCARTDPFTGAKTYPAGFGVGESPTASSGSGMAAHDRSGPRNWIHHNTVDAGCYSGIRINNTNGTLVEDNTVTGNQYGIRIGDLNASHGTTVLRNVFTGNTVGINAGTAEDTIVSGNTATDNTWFGLDFSSAAVNYSITDNDLRRNQVRLLSPNGVYSGNLL
jgi:parallel beta-helix repeat protein